MSHPIRKWLKDLLQYGRRNSARPGDKKPPLLWAADLPRLGQMWMGHYWFRFWLDLHSMPPRVKFALREVFSPHVQSFRPTRLNPIRPLRTTKAKLAAFGAWLDGGGPERALASLGRGTAGIMAGAVGAVVFGAVGIVGSLFAGLAGLIGISTIGTAIGLNSVGRNAGKAFRRTGTGAVALRDGFMEGLGVLASRFRSPRELAWTFATVTGTAGLILLTVLQSIGVTAAPKAADATEVAQAEPEVDPFGGLPDPFGPSDEPLAPPPEPETAPSQSEPVLAREAELDVEVVRTRLPRDVARFNLPDDDEAFLVESRPVNAGFASFPADDWLKAVRPPLVERPPIVPAAYREMSDDLAPAAATLPQPSDVTDRFLPTSAAVNVTVKKSQPAEARPGEMLWYDLVVTNGSDERVPSVVVEEHVAKPHRVADARPAAAFDDGVLTWRLEDLGPHEERVLSVGVYPMSAEPIATSASVRPAAAFSSVTLVQAEEPAAAEPPIVRPDPIERFERGVEPEPRPEVPIGDLRRIKIAMTIPERVADGSPCVIRFAVTNTGDVALNDVSLRGVMSDTLRHREGGIVETTIGDLEPGETKRSTLRLTAAETGEADLFAEVTTAEGVGTNVRGVFSIVESGETEDTPSCCSPSGVMVHPADR